MHALRLKIEGSYFKCKTKNKFTYFHEWVGIAESGKDLSPFPCFLVNGECIVIYLLYLVYIPCIFNKYLNYIFNLNYKTSLHVPHTNTNTDNNEIILVHRLQD